MATQFVKSIPEMKQGNRLFMKRIKGAQVRTLIQYGQTNLKVSQGIAKRANFRGILFSSIKIQNISSTKVRVISSTPGEYGSTIERGIPEKRGFVSFKEQPLLESWVRNKLMSKDKKKAQYFLRIGGVKIGNRGFPFGYPRGLRFMEGGYIVTRSVSNKILVKELSKVADIITGGISFGTTEGITTRVSPTGEVSVGF